MVMWTRANGQGELGCDLGGKHFLYPSVSYFVAGRLSSEHTRSAFPHYGHSGCIGYAYHDRNGNEERRSDVLGYDVTVLNDSIIHDCYTDLLNVGCKASKKSLNILVAVIITVE